MTIDIDPNAGFCFGVTNAIEKAELEISQSGKLLCLGEMVHNQEETGRLEKLGMQTISNDEFSKLKDCTVLFRAHGEPPQTYKTAEQNNIRIIDATCPIVLGLHKIIAHNYQLNPEAQTVIFGKKDHAEVVGLVGQVGGNAIVISSENEISSIDFSKSVLLYSQTTMNAHKYEKIAETIRQKLAQESPQLLFKKFNTVCKSVATREQKLVDYAKQYDAILFVAGSNSSNGKYLYSTCKTSNPRTYYVSTSKDFAPEMFQSVSKLGITGATSTPKWLLNAIADKAKQYAEEHQNKKVN